MALLAAPVDAATLFPVASGEAFDDLTLADADSVTPTATPDTITGEFLDFDQITIFEFDISTLTSPIVSATLNFTATAFAGATTVRVHSYDGDGLLTLADLSNVGLPEAEFLAVAGATPFNIDVTTFINTLTPVVFPPDYAGFEIVDDNNPGPGDGSTISAVSLDITIVPEPATALLLAGPLLAAACPRPRRQR